jgi:uncharacterized protein
MTEHDNLAAVKGAYGAFRRGDIQSVLAIMDEDVDWITPGQKEVVPFVGHFKGRPAVAEFFDSLSENEDVLAFEPREFLVDGDTVVAGVHYRARVKRTGLTYEGEAVHLFRFRNGKVASFKEYIDTVAMASAYRAA